MRQRADQPLRHRKARDRAVILLLVGAVLFLPPVANIFQLDRAFGGIPLPVVYVFAVWAALIAGAAALAPRLQEAEAAEDSGMGSAGTDG